MTFGLSTNFILSIVALTVLGAADVVSMVIRVSLAQIRTPDAMRGRVSAVHSLFTGTSNQLGAFESGLAAALLGAVPAVLLGGLGTVAVAGLWMIHLPRAATARPLRRIVSRGGGSAPSAPDVPSAPGPPEQPRNCQQGSRSCAMRRMCKGERRAYLVPA
jgi:hypothetical protein